MSSQSAKASTGSIYRRKDLLAVDLTECQTMAEKSGTDDDKRKQRGSRFRLPPPSPTPVAISIPKSKEFT
jgi:hypothetical protein